MNWLKKLFASVEITKDIEYTEAIAIVSYTALGVQRTATITFKDMPQHWNGIGTIMPRNLQELKEHLREAGSILVADNDLALLMSQIHSIEIKTSKKTKTITYTCSR